MAEEATNVRRDALRRLASSTNTKDDASEFRENKYVRDVMERLVGEVVDEQVDQVTVHGAQQDNNAGHAHQGANSSN
eukprot:CAMPEP_0198359894 /NCGR_PEP_ID=MMETSP1450-20131203/136263_1 /TAXON_ID=753684 ORGANISM="Madagascaria erythrocladiodes, Strain CCMP3234" /NCGR_SAMPLE_ID=MMETSP1450 /ASSEMBLY_ACC=CAM_ASM_001115 /LENGTH=76 /DNA_ID=CAMNT_0044066825 /DNA_START=193 /DNA_END=423 /DNA_ORIENTATION=+